MKKILFSLSIFLILFIPSVKANSITNIDMEVYIDNSGNAHITEVWNANLSEGTEGYRPYKKLENKEITNFSVTDETGRVYELQEDWDTSSSFSEKAYKNGYHHIYGGVELCWGISNYGSKTYTLNYDISNFITQYTDTQGIYFNFLNLDNSVGNAKITIRSDIAFSLDNAKIWAFGNNGEIIFEDGKIVLNSNGSLTDGQYMVALVRFEENLFATSNISNSSFDDIYDSAMAGNKKYNSFREMMVNRLDFAALVGGVLLFTLVGIIQCFIMVKASKMASKRASKMGIDINTYKTLEFEGDKTLPKEVEYFREIPCNKDVKKAYWFSYNYNISSIRELN